MRDPRGKRNASWLLAALLCTAACGGDSPAQPDPAVTLAIESPLEMPFRGAGGPGAEPISISFQWTVVVSATDEVTVLAVRTELRETASSARLEAASGPAAFNGRLSPRTNARFRQSVSAPWPSSLYPGEWRGTTSVDVLHAGGRTETVTTAFSFR